MMTNPDNLLKLISWSGVYTTCLWELSSRPLYVQSSLPYGFVNKEMLWKKWHLCPSFL